MPETSTAPCDGCPLQVERAVASHGPVPARVLFLSGAPRYHEENEGVAFASPAFPWLEQMLAEVGLDPATVHYATLTGCRPPYQRPLRPAEIEACAPRLDLMINALEGAVVVLCGPDVVAAVLSGVALATGHGALVRRGHRRYYPIRHPYAALHSERYVDEVKADLRALVTLLAEGPPALSALPDLANSDAHAPAALVASDGPLHPLPLPVVAMAPHEPPVDQADRTELPTMVEALLAHGIPAEAAAMTVDMIDAPTHDQPIAVDDGIADVPATATTAQVAPAVTDRDTDADGPTQLSLF